VVEFLDFGEADVYLGAPGLAALRDQFRQAMQGLRAEHHVDEGRARDDGRALLAGDATADADDEVGVRLLQMTHPAEVVEHLFLGLLAHRAGVEEDDVGVFRRAGRGQPFGRIEHVGHLVRVVLVHLAAEGFDVDFFHDPSNRSRTHSMVRLGACLPRSEDAAYRGRQGGAKAESLPLQRLYESGLPLARTKAGARPGVPAGV
jgi:hypothetical protein